MEKKWPQRVEIITILCQIIFICIFKRDKLIAWNEFLNQYLLLFSSMREKSR